MLDHSSLLQGISAELARRRAEAAARPPEKLPRLPKPKKKGRQINDEWRVRDRARRRHHERLGLCKYTKCRGEKCPGGMR